MSCYGFLGWHIGLGTVPRVSVYAAMNFLGASDTSDLFLSICPAGVLAQIPICLFCCLLHLCISHLLRLLACGILLFLVIYDV